MTVSSWGQTKADQAAVLQKCLDLPALESAYAKDINGQPEQLVVMEPGFVFVNDLPVTKFEMSLRFMTKNSIYNQKIDNVLFIGKFEVGATNASVALVYYRNFTGKWNPTKATIELTKSGDTWNVISSNIENN
jgi:hypothetical protein